MSGGSTGTPAETPTGDAYISVNTANTYFVNQLNIAEWTAASTGDKNKALIMATLAIEQLNFLGEKNDDEQTFEFPRYDDDAIPQAVQDACAELALAFVKGIDEDLEIEAMRIQSESVDTMKTSYHATRVNIHIVNGIPSIKAWRLLQPYLEDNETMVLDKVP